MTVSTVVTLSQEEKKALTAAADVLEKLLNFPYSDQYSTIYYSGGNYDNLDFDNLSEMERMLEDLAEAKDLELEP